MRRAAVPKLAMNAIDNMPVELFWIMVLGILFCVYVVRER